MGAFQVIATAALAAATGILTALITARLQARNEIRKWEREKAITLSKLIAEDLTKGMALASQLATSYIRDSAGRKFFFAPGARLIVGRDPEAAIRFDDEDSMSRKHAAFEVRSDGTWLTDLHTVNGTIVNGQRLSQGESVRLNDGDTIRFCRNSVVKFHDL
ncbi:FHA domain-containing protein [Actinoplanes sp. L3-i22]|uniref:FHA domain-containing protein n=1 Tax=Actinoplanes sp. L3-i22 TaxID=2836373 RepID=UPI001C7766B4|nr:FHA domain-containing protein [Actinoplanes sp. L3-i22]BCY11110.1 hypothetical protein L3i22_061980 [Actinoplanes sp. L3-i22]